MLHLILTFAGLLFTPVIMAAEELCPGVVLHAGEEVSLSETEKNLICGDPNHKAYQTIPTYQAQFFFTGFLQSRSYLRPTFEIKDGVLHIYTGPESKLKKVIILPEDEQKASDLEREIERLHKDKSLNPRLLNEIEAEALGYLRRNGYPCAKVETLVDAKESSATLTLDRTVLHQFGEVKKDQIKGLHPNALDRYYPFEEDELFSERLTLLAERRMTRAQAVQGTYFLENCSEDGESFSMSQYFIEGPPRTFRFGAGASTEQGPMARARWTNHRHASMASILSANLQASFRTQSLTLMADSFFWKHEPRRSLYSEFEIKRESQLDYDELTVRAKPHVKWTLDYWNRHWLWTIGPTFETGTFSVLEEKSTQTFSAVALEGGMQWMSHIYELFDIHPGEGDTFNFNFSARHPSLGFSDPLLRLDSSIMKLYRLRDSGRGALIGGVRFNAGTTWVSDDVTLNSLPPSVKHYGGGSDDVRGFFLNTLPKNDGLGALSKLGLKLELRRTRLFLESLEGFTFIDGAYFGDRSWSTEPRLWHSPGVGLHWLTPIGLVQTFVARALVTNPYEDLGNLYFLGLGGTF
jgi:outer membrane protein assembly factor BamA